MRLILSLSILVACADPGTGYAPAALTIDADGGTIAGSPLTLDPGERWFAEQADGTTDPVLWLRWEDPQQGVLKIGEGQNGFGYDGVRVTQIDALEKVVLMTNGRARIKLQDHPVGLLLHLSEVPNLWFGNTNREPVEIAYQGASLGDGDAIGEPFLIEGQAVNGTATATSVTGGDLTLRAGSASSAYSIPLDPGEVLIQGGAVGGTTRGNVALHDEPLDWCEMEGGLYVHDAATVPTADPADGGFLYAEGGALYWRGSAGTVTQVAAP